MRRVMIAAAVTLLAVAGPGRAQPAVPAATSSARPDPAGERAMARVEQHIADLRKRLAIGPAQETQWAAFADVMRENARDMERSYNERQARARGSALEDMRGYAASAKLHADHMARLVAPFEALYGALSPEQQSSADKTFQAFQRGEGKRGL